LLKEVGRAEPDLRNFESTGHHAGRRSHRGGADLQRDLAMAWMSANAVNAPSPRSRTQLPARHGAATVRDVADTVREKLQLTWEQPARCGAARAARLPGGLGANSRLPWSSAVAVRLP